MGADLGSILVRPIGNQNGRMGLFGWRGGSEKKTVSIERCYSLAKQREIKEESCPSSVMRQDIGPISTQLFDSLAKFIEV